MIRDEHQSKAGSSPIIRFFPASVLVRLLWWAPWLSNSKDLRLGGGDLNALFGIAGFAGGIGFGTIFLNKAILYNVPLCVEQIRICYDAGGYSSRFARTCSNSTSIYLL